MNDEIVTMLSCKAWQHDVPSLQPSITKLNFFRCILKTPPIGGFSGSSYGYGPCTPFAPDRGQQQAVMSWCSDTLIRWYRYGDTPIPILIQILIASSTVTSHWIELWDCRSPQLITWALKHVQYTLYTVQNPVHMDTECFTELAEKEMTENGPKWIRAMFDALKVTLQSLHVGLHLKAPSCCNGRPKESNLVLVDECHDPLCWGKASHLENVGMPSQDLQSTQIQVLKIC